MRAKETGRRIILFLMLTPIGLFLGYYLAIGLGLCAIDRY
jgi:hypothetical protein